MIYYKRVFLFISTKIYKILLSQSQIHSLADMYQSGVKESRVRILLRYQKPYFGATKYYTLCAASL